jgi:hypothetical protein
MEQLMERYLLPSHEAHHVYGFILIASYNFGAMGGCHTLFWRNAIGTRIPPSER